MNWKPQGDYLILESRLPKKKADAPILQGKYGEEEFEYFVYDKGTTNVENGTEVMIPLPYLNKIVGETYKDSSKENRYYYINVHDIKLIR